MSDRILLPIFFICLVCCGSMVLGTIWLQDLIKTQLYFQTAATFFVVGLASFLVWFSLMFRILVRNHKSP